jgi:hypothetical protein
LLPNTYWVNSCSPAVNLNLSSGVNLGAVVNYQNLCFYKINRTHTLRYPLSSQIEQLQFTTTDA